MILSPLQVMKFLQYVTMDVVVAVAECDVYDNEMENTLALFSSTNAGQLSKHMTIELLMWGYVVVRAGVADHTPPVFMKKYEFLASIDNFHSYKERFGWSVVKVDRSDDGSGRGAVDIYVLTNVGREGWCVVTASYHTLLHILRIHNKLSPEDWPCETLECVDGKCEQLCKTLVPRMRPLVVPLELKECTCLANYDVLDYETTLIRGTRYFYNPI